MEPKAIRHELCDRLKATIPSVQWHAGPPGTVNAPAGYFQPQELPYDLTVDSHGLDMALVILAGRPNEQPAHDVLDELAAVAGEKSIKEKLESGTYMTFDTASLHVRLFLWDNVTLGGVTYLAGVVMMSLQASEE